jgi:hypothetical protein
VFLTEMSPENPPCPFERREIMHQISRRSFLSATALAGAAFAMPAGAGAPLAGIQGPGVYRFKLGDYQVTALFDGVWYLPIDDKFVRNASGAEVKPGSRCCIPATRYSANIVHRADGEHRRQAGAD